MPQAQVSDPSDIDFTALAPREAACLRLAATLTAKEAALKLGLSYRSVQQYQHAACKKLGVTGSRRAAWLLLEHERLQGVEQVQAEHEPVAPVDLEVPIGPSAPLPHLKPVDPRDDLLHDSGAPFVAWQEAIDQAVRQVPDGRVVRLCKRDRMLLVIAWALSAPLVLALIVTAYLGLTMIEKGLFKPG